MARSWVFLLGPVRGPAVLPFGPRAVAARNLRRARRPRRQAAPSGPAGRAQAFHAGLCQRAPSLATLSQRLLSIALPLPRSGRHAWVSFQEQVAHAGRHADRTLRLGLRLGAVSAHERSGEAASVA